MRRCYNCHKNFEEQKMIFINKHRYCNNCFKKLFILNSKGEFITKGNEEAGACELCGTVIPRKLRDDLGHLCTSCFKERYDKNNSSYNKVIKCLKCGKFHLKNEDCLCIREMYLPDRNRFVVGNVNASREFKGTLCYEYLDLDNIKIQTLIPNVEEIDGELENFYEDNPIDTSQIYPSHWKDIHVEGEITFLNSTLLKTIVNNLHADYSQKIDDIKKGFLINKYSGMKLTGIKDGKLERTKVNLMGKVVVSYESANKFLVEHGFNESKAQLSGTYKYVLSTNLEHKLDGLIANDDFRSCQHKGNSVSYALGAYDFITNGCNVPLLIYKEGKVCPIGRILCRLMYDKSNKEYLVVERIYHNGEFGGQTGSDASKGYVLKAIIEDLIKKGFNVVVTPFSAHDMSVYSYLMTMGGFKKEKIVKSLTQPARILYKPCGYYCDGGTKVHGYRLYDELLKKLDDINKTKCINETGKTFMEMFDGKDIRLGRDTLSKGYLLSLE